MSKSNKVNSQVSKPKQLTMNKIKTEAKNTYKMEEYSINDKDEVIKFYPVFPGSKIDEVIKEYQEDLIYAQSNDIESFGEDDGFTIEYILFLCIKHFTSLEKGFSQNLENKILQMKYLIDAGYYQQIIDEVFMQQEIRKVLDRISGNVATDNFIKHIGKVSEEKLNFLKEKNEEYLKTISAIESGNKH